MELTSKIFVSHVFEEIFATSAEIADSDLFWTVNPDPGPLDSQLVVSTTKPSDSRREKNPDFFLF